MKPHPLFGSSIQAISPAITTQRRVNVFYDIRPDMEQAGAVDKAKIVLRNFPGLTFFTNLPTFPVRGWTVALNYLYVVAGNTLYQVNQVGGYIKIGTITSTTLTPVSIAINETQIMIVDGIDGFAMNYNIIDNTAQTLANQTQLNLLTSEVSFLTQLCQQTGNQ